MSFLDPTNAPQDEPDIDPADFDKEDSELTSLAEQLRTQLEEIDSKRADVAKRRTQAGPSQTQIREVLMDKLSLFDDEDDPMPAGVRRILDKHVKEWQRTYRQRAREEKLPQAKASGGIAGSGFEFDHLLGEGSLNTLTQEVDDWFARRANSRNRRGANAPVTGSDPDFVDRVWNKSRGGRK